MPGNVDALVPGSCIGVDMPKAIGEGSEPGEFFTTFVGVAAPLWTKKPSVLPTPRGGDA